MNFLSAFLDMLYPPRCVICDKPIHLPGYCKRCEGKIKPNSEERCFSCGLSVKRCECKRIVYHFDGVTAPFYNKGYPQEAVYALKFSSRFSCVEPFAEEMAKTAVNTFGRENIDLISFVPANKKSLYSRGFNQSELFATHISKILGIPIHKKLLAKKEEVKTQHDLSTIVERFRNVRNSYYATERIKGKNVLLVDDIKTTGASLDECARQLKFAGADKVFCVTALISDKHDK